MNYRRTETGAFAVHRLNLSPFQSRWFITSQIQEMSNVIFTFVCFRQLHSAHERMRNWEHPNISESSHAHLALQFLNLRTKLGGAVELAQISSVISKRPAKYQNSLKIAFKVLSQLVQCQICHVERSCCCLVKHKELKWTTSTSQMKSWWGLGTLCSKSRIEIVVFIKLLRMIKHG